MPGFCFSPTMINQNIVLFTKCGKDIQGIVVEVNPAEIVLKNTKTNALIRINRDEVEAYTGTDDKKRNPDIPKLFVTRCYNMTVKCNGVKKISMGTGSINDFKDCSAHNEYCECITSNFFDMQKHIQVKLLNGIMVGEYPKRVGGEEE